MWTIIKGSKCHWFKIHIVSDSKCMKMQLLNLRGGPGACFIEVIKCSHHVYGSLDHFRQLKTGGGVFIGAWESLTTWYQQIQWLSLEDHLRQKLIKLGGWSGKRVQTDSITVNVFFKLPCNYSINNNRTATIIIVKPTEHPEYDGHYSRQLIGIKSFEFDTTDIGWETFFHYADY